MTSPRYKEKNLREALARRLPLWRESPCLFARELLRFEPTEQQTALLNDIANPGAHVSVSSGHGTGKSTSEALAAIWFLMCFPDAIIPCTAPTESQLTNILWKEMRSLVQRIHPLFRRQIKITQGRITLEGSQGYIVARTSRPEKPEGLQGFHGENILFIIEEASGVPVQVFESARGALSTPNARVLMCSNPTLLSGFFYDIMHSPSKLWKRHFFSCLDSPLVSEEYPKEIATEYGIDSDMYRVRVLGQFPRMGMRSLISPADVENALSRERGVFDQPTGVGILGVDPAWEGDDRSAIVYRRGSYAKVLLARPKLNGVQLASEISHLCDNAELNIQGVFIDKTGVGASVCDQLEVLGLPHIRVSFGEEPNDKSHYLNRRAEIWDRMAKWIAKDTTTIEYHKDLLTDLIAPTFEFNSKGQMVLESKKTMKKRGVKSPDLGDALALTFHSTVLEMGYGSTSNHSTKSYNPYEVFERRR